MTPLPPPTAAIRNGSPLVSVVVPCFGEGRYLDDCLTALRQQTYQHLEILVIEDAGQTDALDVAMAHALEDQRITLLRTHQNIGLGAVRNLATNVAKGDLLFFLDGDDWVPVNSVRCRVDALTAYLADADETTSRRIAGVFGQGQHAPFDAGPGQEELPCPALMPINLANSRGANIFIVSAPLVRRDLLALSDGFAEGVPGAEDHLCWMRLLALDTVFLPVERVVAFYRQKPTSMLRDSATTFAAFGIAARNWVSEVITKLPSAQDPQIHSDLDLAATGDRTMRWGRPRRTPTRMSATGVNGAARPPAPTEPNAHITNTPPLLSSPLLQPAIETAQRFLEGATQPGRFPSTTVFENAATGLVTAHPANFSHPRGSGPGQSDSSTVTLSGHTLSEGLTCAALALLLDVPVRLALTPSARKGALLGLSVLDTPLDSVAFVTPDHSSNRPVTVKIDGTQSHDDQTRQLALTINDARTVVQEFLANALTELSRLGSIALIYDITADPTDRVGALEELATLDRRTTLAVIDAASSRLLADASVPHQPATLTDIYRAEHIAELGPSTNVFVQLVSPDASPPTDPAVSSEPDPLARLRRQLDLR